MPTPTEGTETAPPSRPTDEQVEALAKAAAAGCHQALTDLYASTVAQVFQYMHARTSSRHTAEDLTSETWLSAAANITGYRHQQNKGFMAWLFTIARNKLIDFYRSRDGARVTYQSPLDMAEVWSDIYVDRTATGLPEQVTEAIENLPQRQHETVVLCDLLGLTLAEVAAVLGRRPASVRKAHARAMGALRETLGGQGRR